MGKSALKRPVKWERDLSAGVTGMLDSIRASTGLAQEHTENTPQRVLESFAQMFEGVGLRAEDVLTTTFASPADQMIHVSAISFFSVCCHHLVPFYGKAWFAYIPDGKVVGLSKVPRLVEMFARRPQVQEQLTEQIADAFQRIVEPRGCGVHIRAHHLCAMARGVKQSTSFMQTTALRGLFHLDASVKNEFLQATQHRLER